MLRNSLVSACVAPHLAAGDFLAGAAGPGRAKGRGLGYCLERGGRGVNGSNRDDSTPPEERIDRPLVDIRTTAIQYIYYITGKSVILAGELCS